MQNFQDEAVEDWRAEVSREGAATLGLGRWTPTWAGEPPAGRLEADWRLAEPRHRGGRGRGQEGVWARAGQQGRLEGRPEGRGPRGKAREEERRGPT